MATTAILQRAPVTVPAIENVDEALLAEADRLLNYSGPWIRERASAADRARRVLAELKLQPFTPQSVRAYQRGLIRRDVARWIVFGASLCALAAVATVTASRVLPNAPMPWWGYGLVALCGISTAVSLFAGVGAIVEAFRHKPEWSWMQLTHYHAPVPTFVLLTATTVTRALTAANISHHFGVDVFRDRAAIRAREFERTADPFLTLTVQGMPAVVFYLEVWDEPRFDRTRQI